MLHMANLFLLGITIEYSILRHSETDAYSRYSDVRSDMSYLRD
jgi:hypothetical protein